MTKPATAWSGSNSKVAHFFRHAVALVGRQLAVHGDVQLAALAVTHPAQGNVMHVQHALHGTGDSLDALG